MFWAAAIPCCLIFSWAAANFSACRVASPKSLANWSNPLFFAAVLEMFVNVPSTCSRMSPKEAAWAATEAKVPPSFLSPFVKLRTRSIIAVFREATSSGADPLPFLKRVRGLAFKLSTAAFILSIWLTAALSLLSPVKPTPILIP